MSTIAAPYPDELDVTDGFASECIRNVEFDG
jgi:hypothetical protein